MKSKLVIPIDWTVIKTTPRGLHKLDLDLPGLPVDKLLTI